MTAPRHVVSGAVLLVGPLLSALSAADAPEFFRGVNLGGPAVTIDGRTWDGGDAGWVRTKDQTFDKQDVALTPPTDDERARMIRSSTWDPGGENRVELRDLPPGTYSLFLYAWEDNNSEMFDVLVQGRRVLRRHESGGGGTWKRLGPWTAEPKDGVIEITSRGGHANFSGVEVWKGEISEGAVPLTPEQLAFFESKIRPVLAERCYDCHSTAADTAEGDLLLDTRAGVLHGGNRGAAVVPGDVGKSLLVRAIRHADDKLKMPPDEKLTDEQICDLETWIAGGAPDPRDGRVVNLNFQKKLAEAREFWSFQPVREPELPAVRDAEWPLSPIDRFIIAKLEEKGLKPVETADRRTLIRRATFDLTGLPPTPEEVEAFLADPAPLQEAFATVVDRLLASPAYGERWGRHWMDLVRYADTAGDNSDYPVPQLYLYRNYIIDSLNRDKPYDEFLREQIAGDMLPAANVDEKNEQTIATGYIAISRRFGSVVDRYPYHLTIEDTIDNLGRTVLGLTINCSRCHNHKFDPISQEDYYGLYGIFESTKYPFPGIELEKKPRDFVTLEKTDTFPGGTAYAVSEGKSDDTRLQRRGEPRDLGHVVPRKFLEILGGQRLSEEEAQASGRRQLAEWLTDPKNPLTARVMVNRVWHYHFGRGIVPTPSDFGTRGLPPSHPELLDWLAHRFVADGWSLKALHRRIMLSRVYQISSKDDSANLAADPNNEWRWRFDRRRLDAESIRDAVLAVSGRLDPSMPREPHPFPPAEKWGFTQHYPFKESYPSDRRSVYLMRARLNTLPFFATFDGADTNASSPRRDSSVTTVQALYLLNDESVHEQAGALAERLLRERPDDGQRLERMFALCLGRPPREDERLATESYMQQMRELLAASGTPSEQHDREVWQALARVVFRLNEFLYVD